MATRKNELNQEKKYANIFSGYILTVITMGKGFERKKMINVMYVQFLPRHEYKEAINIINNERGHNDK